VRAATVTADIAYLCASDGRPRFHLQEPEKDRNTFERVAVEIRDARPLRASLKLDVNGFELFDYKTGLTGWAWTDAEYRAYEQELEGALREITGAARVIITRTRFVRISPTLGETHVADQAEPAAHVHSDCTEISGPAVVRGHLGPGAVASLLGKRFAVYSLWRALSPPPQDMPIAVCDAQSVSKEHVIRTDVVLPAPGRPVIYEGMGFRYSRDHKWYYFRDMERHELLVMKAYDSQAGCAWRVPHTAFTDPSAPAGAPPRVSIDVRAIALFG
jgi:hypothetical protein